MKKLAIAEKPSVGHAIAQALHVSGSHDGYIENDEWIITWCFGHLLELCYPEKYDEKYKKWNLEDLPFLPKEYKHEPITESRDQLKIVKELLNRADIIYNFGDAGREGELIQRLVYDYCGVEGKKKILRVWIDAQTDDAIRNGIKNARSAEQYDNLYAAGLMRSIADYGTGINLSRALSCKFGYVFNKQIASDKYKPISVGRVMTCVLGMVVKREREIKNFVSADFYKIDAEHSEFSFSSHWKAGDGSRFKDSVKLYNETGLREKADAEALLKDLATDPCLTVESLEKTTKKKNAPLLYNLAELQSDGSRRFKISPDKTLEIAQSLYEKGYTTYPRTDARVLSTAIAAEISNNLDGLRANVPEMAKFIDAIKKMGTDATIASTKYCDDKKITDHYAIIPTGLGSASALDGLEKEIYMCIVRRFVAIFCPPAEYLSTSIVLRHSTGEPFAASENVLVKAGYLAVSGKGEDDITEKSGMGALTEGAKVNADFKLIESKTQPPKRYTSGSMILAMENAGKLIEEPELREQIKANGIGTSATRADTIKKLVKITYLKLENKTQVLSPTPTGEAVYDIVDQYLPDMLDPKMTASWEKGLSQIEDGTITKDKYMSIFEDDIKKKVALIKAQISEEPERVAREEVGTCPCCGKTVYTSKFGWMCSGYKKDDPKSCHFSVPYEAWGHKLTEDEMNALLSGGETGEIEFTKKTGEKFVSKLVVAHGRTGLPTQSAGRCPSCGGDLVMDNYSYKCTSCDFRLWKKLGNREMTMNEYNLLLANGVSSKIGGFSNKDGEPYEAYLIYRRKNIYIVKSEMSGYTMTQADIETLHKDGKTENRSFTSKQGKPFEARIKLSSNGFTEFEFDKKAKGGKK